MAETPSTWLGAAFVGVLDNHMDSRRLSRGRAYSNPNRLLEFSVKGATVRALVLGNQSPYLGVYHVPRYNVEIELAQIQPSGWDRIIKVVGSNVACMSQLLLDEMPESIDELSAKAGVSLLPGEPEDLKAECDCPDWDVPCKHIAGVYYKLATVLDRDPMLLFQLRGMKPSELKSRLAKTPLGKAFSAQQRASMIKVEHDEHRYTQPVSKFVGEVSPKSFWQGDTPLPVVDPVPDTPAIEAALIKHGGENPAFWHIYDSFIATMEDAYTYVVEKNKTII